METKKQMAAWMDHSTAHIMQMSAGSILSTIITSEFTPEERSLSLSKGENLMHNKEQQLQSDYYKTITESLKGAESILLFGPTNAKSELHNLLKADHHFDKVDIELKDSDKMSGSEQEHFFRVHLNSKMIFNSDKTIF